MNVWHGKKIIKNNIYSNNRINIIMAIVFLLGCSILYKLYELQVEKYDFYTVSAMNQHQVSSILSPSRGKIFMSDHKTLSAELNLMQNSEDEFYPFATNKDFALVYAVPKDIKEPEDIAEKLYIIFNQEEVEKEVDEFLDDEEKNKLKEELSFLDSLNLNLDEKASKEAEVRQRYDLLPFNKEYQELRAIKKEAEINFKKDEIIKTYLEILTKKNDPYEPIKKKVDEETLIRMYSLIASKEGIEISENDLKIKEGKIFRKYINGEEKELVLDGISYVMATYRFYPENNIGSHILGFTSSASEDQEGNYGLEGFFNEELLGKYGSIKTERGADRNVIIVNDREYIEPEKGVDLVLTINRSIQFFICNKLDESAERHGADGGSIIVMEPETGAIIAMCSWPNFDPNKYEDVEDIKIYNNPVIFDQYEPGSIFKSITMAAALDQGRITPETLYNDEGQVMVDGWPKPIKNSDCDTHGGWGEVNMNIVLEESLNTGAIFAMRQIGAEIFSKYVKDFGFGEKTGIELETENAGDIKNLTGKKIQEIYAATASFGQGITVTPLQMISAYNAIANGGILMKPYIVKEIIHSDGTKDITKPTQLRRVISQKAATLVSGMMVNVVEGGHAKNASVEGYWIGGKTGTAQVASSDSRGYGSKTMHTFVGFAPADEPVFVMLVKLDDPKDVSFSASSAAPLFGEIAEFLLNYYQVPKNR